MPDQILGLVPERLLLLVRALSEDFKLIREVNVTSVRNRVQVALFDPDGLVDCRTRHPNDADLHIGFRPGDRKVRHAVAVANLDLPAFTLRQVPAPGL